MATNGALPLLPAPANDGKTDGDGISISTPRRIIRPRTKNQASYLEALLEHDLVLGLGPAGTGKTYLAVAVGVTMLARGEVERLTKCASLRPG